MSTSVSMARRRIRKKEAELLQGLAGLVFFGSFFYGYNATGSWKGAAIAAGCVLGLIFAIVIVIKIVRKRMEYA